jgi:hypothetical protein
MTLRRINVKKILCYFMFLLFVVNAGFSQENIIPIGKFRDYRDYRSFIEFKTNNRIEKWQSNRDETYKKLELLSGEYSLTNIDGITFLTILWDSGTWGKYVFLTTETHNIWPLCFFLYDSNSEPYFIGFRGDDGTYYGDHGLDGDIGMGGLSFSSDWITSTSFLIENGISYSSEKLGYRIGEAWAYRFGETNIFGTLEINIPQFSLPQDVYISIGFISHTNPQLYRQNARPKKIKISWNDNDYRIIDLEDTPHFQYIGSLKGAIKIEIVEIYPGTRYQDVCINAFYSGAWQ